MIDFVFEYLDNNGIYASSEIEQRTMEAGIERFLQENGIRLDETREYHRSYLTKLLRRIDISDLKAYFVNYHLLSEVNQVVIEVRSGEKPSQKHRDRLYRAMQELNRVGLGEKYIPVVEVKQLLGKFA